MVYHCSDNTTTFDQIQAFSAKYFHFLAKLFPFLSKKNIARFQAQPRRKERVLLHDAAAPALLAKKNIARFQAQPHQKERCCCMTQQIPALLAKKNIIRFQAQPHQKERCCCMTQQPHALLAKKNIARLPVQPCQKERGCCMTQQPPCISGPLGCSLNALVLQDAIHKPFRPGNIPGVHVFHNQWNVGMMFCQKRYVQVVI